MRIGANRQGSLPPQKRVNAPFVFLFPLLSVQKRKDFVMARKHNHQYLRAIALSFGVLLLPLPRIHAQSPSFRWVEKSGGPGNDYGYGIAVDGAGNSYVAGSFNGSATFGETSVISQGGADIFIAKYDNGGNLLWVRSAGGATNDAASAVAVDGSGNCYVTGVFQGTATFGNTSLTSAGGPDIFIAKYDSAGNFVWARQAGGSSDDRGYAVAALSVPFVQRIGGSTTPSTVKRVLGEASCALSEAIGGVVIQKSP